MAASRCARERSSCAPVTIADGSGASAVICAKAREGEVAMETVFGEVPDRFGQLSMAEADELLHRRVGRRLFLKGAAGVGIAAAVPVLWRQPGAQALAPNAQRLVYGTDPRTTMTVSWSTPGPVTNPRLDLGTTTAYGSTFPAATTTVAGVATNYHRVVLTGLAAGSLFHYRSRHNGGTASDRTFTTAPGAASTTPFTFTAFGDQGTGSAASNVVTNLQTVAPAFNLHAGDLCYAAGSGNGTGSVDPTQWDSWLNTIQKVASRTPWMATVGNHEMEPGFGPQGYGGYGARLALTTVGAHGASYSYRYANVAVVCLDANDVSEEIPHNKGYTAGGQTAWLSSTLAAYRSDPTIDFIVVQYHHCTYCSSTAHGSEGGARVAWVPLFDANEVDLVVNGHNHCYERTHPMIGGAVQATVPSGGTVTPATQGTTYVVAGGGGAGLYTSFSANPFVHTASGAVRETRPWSAKRSATHGFLAIDVVPALASGAVTTMTVRSMRSATVETERITLQRTHA
jgi:hypothetical protein